MSLRRTGREDARLDLFSLARLVWAIPSAFRFRLLCEPQSLRLWSMANRTKRHWPIRKLEGIPSIGQSALGSELFGADESRERVLKDTESHIDGAS